MKCGCAARRQWCGQQLQRVGDFFATLIPLRKNPNEPTPEEIEREAQQIEAHKRAEAR